MASPLRKLFDNPMSYSPEQDARLAQVQQLQEQADPWFERRQAREKAMVVQDPLVQQQLQDERAFELEKEVAPARMQGEYAVRAAETKGQREAEQANLLLSLFRGQGVPEGGRVSIPGVGSVSTPQPKVSQAALAQKNQLQQLLTGKTHAPRPQGEGMWGRMAPSYLGGGPSQRDLDQQEINRLLLTLGGGQQNDPSEAPAQAGTAPGGGMVTLEGPTGSRRTMSEAEAQRYLASGRFRIVE